MKNTTLKWVEPFRKTAKAISVHHSVGLPESMCPPRNIEKVRAVFTQIPQSSAQLGSRQLKKTNKLPINPDRLLVPENYIVTRNSHAKYQLQPAGASLCILQRKVRKPFLCEILRRILFEIRYFSRKYVFLWKKPRKTDFCQGRVLQKPTLQGGGGCFFFFFLYNQGIISRTTSRSKT